MTSDLRLTSSKCLHSFHALTTDQLQQTPFHAGAATPLSPPVAEQLSAFFDVSKIKSVTLGHLHPDPETHSPNLGCDFVYLTTDSSVEGGPTVVNRGPTIEVGGIQKTVLELSPNNQRWDVEVFVKEGCYFALMHLLRHSGSSEGRQEVPAHGGHDKEETGKEAQKQLKEAQLKLEIANREIAMWKKEVSSLEQKLEDYKAAPRGTEALENEIAQLKGNLREAAAVEFRQSNELSTAKSKISDLSQQLKTVKEEKAQLEETYSRCQKERRAAAKAVSEASERLQQLEQQLAEAKEENTQLKAAIEEQATIVRKWSLDATVRESGGASTRDSHPTPSPRPLSPPHANPDTPWIPPPAHAASTWGRYQGLGSPRKPERDDELRKGESKVKTPKKGGGVQKGQVPVEMEVRTSIEPLKLLEGVYKQKDGGAVPSWKCKGVTLLEHKDYWGFKVPPGRKVNGIPVAVPADHILVASTVKTSGGKYPTDPTMAWRRATPSNGWVGIGKDEFSITARKTAQAQPSPPTPPTPSLTGPTKCEVVMDAEDEAYLAEQRRIEAEWHLSQFKGREDELLRLLKGLYGPKPLESEREKQLQEELRAAKEREEALRSAAEEIESLRSSLAAAEEQAKDAAVRSEEAELNVLKLQREVEQGRAEVERLRKQEEGIARAFLQADEEARQEVISIRRELFNAKADATIANTELAAIKSGYKLPNGQQFVDLKMLRGVLPVSDAHRAETPGTRGVSPPRLTPRGVPFHGHTPFRSPAEQRGNRDVFSPPPPQ